MLIGVGGYPEATFILRTLLVLHPSAASAQSLIQGTRRPGIYGPATVTEFVRFLYVWSELCARLEPHGMTIVRTNGRPEGLYCISRF